MAGDFTKRLIVLGEDRLLDKHRPQGLQLMGQNLGHALVNAAVKIHGNVHLIAQSVPNGGHPP